MDSLDLKKVLIFVDSNDSTINYDLTEPKWNFNYTKKLIPDTVWEEKDFGFKVKDPNPFFPTTFELLPKGESMDEPI